MKRLRGCVAPNARSSAVTDPWTPNPSSRIARGVSAAFGLAMYFPSQTKVYGFPRRASPAASVATGKPTILVSEPSSVPPAIPRTGSTAAPSASAVTWQLRGAWASRREVVLVGVDVRGYIEHVAPTGSFALVWDGAGLIHVPADRVLAVRVPHFHEDGDTPSVAPPPPRSVHAPPPPGQLAFNLNDERIVDPRCP
jgi:hypothetical protein